MPANYDNAAWFYDRLSRLVYGRQLTEAHRFLIPYIPAGAHVLIVGGGTGYVLDEITRQHPSRLIITYVEISARMTALARKRHWGDNKVTFINCAIEAVDLDQYEVIFTPFLFDNFRQAEFKALFDHLHCHLLPGGRWLNADFQLTGRWWQPVLLKTMFLFFKLLGCVEVSQLPDIDQEFHDHHYQSIARQTFFGGFISSVIYQHKAG